MYLSRIRFLAETDRLEMSLFVAVTTNSVSSWAILPVMVLVSTPKTGTVILGELFFFWTYRLVVCCLLLVVRAWLTNVKIRFESLPHRLRFDFVFLLRLVC